MYLKLAFLHYHLATCDHVFVLGYKRNWYYIHIAFQRPPVLPRSKKDLLKGIPADQPLHQYPDIDFSQTNPNPSSHHYFLKAISGMSVSEDYCKNKFTNDNIIERNLFEFVNRVGAYIAYIFIESLRPITNDTDATENKKKERTLLLVNKAIPVERLFRKFCLLLSELGIMRSMDLHITEEGMSEELQLNQSSFDKLSDSFKRVYPRVYKLSKTSGLIQENTSTSAIHYLPNIPSVFTSGKIIICTKLAIAIFVTNAIS